MIPSYFNIKKFAKLNLFVHHTNKGLIEIANFDFLKTRKNLPNLTYFIIVHHINKGLI